MPDKVIFSEDSRSDQNLVVRGDPGAVFVAEQLAQCPVRNPANALTSVEVVNKLCGVWDQLVSTTIPVD